MTRITCDVEREIGHVWKDGILYNRYRLSNFAVACVRASIYRTRDASEPVTVADSRDRSGHGIGWVHKNTTLKSGDRFTYSIQA
jgi:hypothetical protein